MKRKIKRFLALKSNVKYCKITLFWFFLNTLYWYVWLKSPLIYLPLGYWLILAVAFFAPFLILLKDVLRFKRPTIIKKQIIIKDRKSAIIVFVDGTEKVEAIKRRIEAIFRFSEGKDFWVLVDKMHSPKIEEVVAYYNYYYFSRHDTDRWGTTQVSTWNSNSVNQINYHSSNVVNAWLDKYGDNYTQLTHIDIKEKPKAGYINNLLSRYFQSSSFEITPLINLSANQKWVLKTSLDHELEGADNYLARSFLYIRNAKRE